MKNVYAWNFTPAALGSVVEVKLAPAAGAVWLCGLIGLCRRRGCWDDAVSVSSVAKITHQIVISKQIRGCIVPVL
jgi:hypothetical protein